MGIAAATGHVLAQETNPSAYYNRGMAHIARKEWSEAIGELSEAIRINPSNASAYEYRGGALFAQGRFEDAISDFTHVVEIQPTNGMAYFNRASANRSAHRFERVLADVNESLRLIPTNGAAYKLRASMYSFRGEFNDAIKDWSEGLRLNPEDANTLTCRGSDYFQSGQFEKALDDHRKAIRLDPTCDLAYNNLAWLLATCPATDRRNGKQAVEAATKACELTKWQRWDWIDTLAAAYAEAGDFEKAISSQKRALSFQGISEADRQQAERQLALYANRQANHNGQK